MNDEPTYEDLLTLNQQLANQLIGMSDRLQESARQIAAAAWDAGHRFSGYEPDEDSNPYRQPLDPLGLEA